MYLKRLESVGFKSFAERINVDFVPGVTAVVGPNGSGKSNITDAIRWVLGEQSARSLRGSKMEDIIFQGSDTRRPLNVAEVTLVLENSDKGLPLDYEEVSVTRRVYRSGESEFYLNKQSCRLKDIIDLFMDSGLGREAFSIISQGKVEEILSSKAEERRTIFEEAAGVLKYKQRKKKAEYKLAETQENLNRVEDIIHEIEQQIGPLKEQAETAETYLEKKEQLKRHEISLLVTEIEQLHETWQSMLNDLENDKLNEINMKTTIQKHESRLENERQQVQDIDDKIESLQADLLSSTEKLERFESKKKLFHERTKHFDENKQKLETQKGEAASKIERLQAELREENKKLSDIQESRNHTKQLVSQLETKLTTETDSLADQIEELKSDYIEYLNDQAAKRNEKQSIQEQLQQISGKKHRKSEKYATLLDERNTLSTQQDRLNNQLTAQEQNYNELSASFQKLKDKLNNERTSFQEAQTKLYQGFQYLEKLKSKKEMLEDMKEDFQGFFYGVKEVLKAREDKKLRGIHGAVIELIDVPKKYITAIETVLGGQAQHVVVDNDQFARQAITWLKKTNSGRATFLPLGSIQPRFIPKDVRMQVEQHEGYVGVASELVSSEFQTAVKHLMGHVLVAKTLKDANEIAAIVNRRNRVVTLEGDVVNPGGSMSGGAKKKTNQSLFTREKDLQEISHKLNDYQKRTDTFEDKVHKQKQAIEKLEQELQEKEQTVVAEQQKLHDIRTAYKETEMKLGSLNENLSFYDQDNQQFDRDRKDLQNRDEQLEGALNELAEKLKEIQRHINDRTAEKEELQENREQIQHDLQAERVKFAEQEERWKSQREKRNSIKEQLNGMNEQFSAYTVELEDLLDMQHTSETEEEIDQNLQSVKAEKESIQEQIQQLRSDRLERTQRIQDQGRELKEENKKHQAFVQSIQEKEVKTNRLDVELENRLSKLQTEYMITFEKAKKTYDKTEDPDQTRSIVEQLNRGITQLGTVNLGAIEEFERISERYGFLSEQQNDLVEAKQTLYSVIAEMDEEMKSRFGDTFNQIKEEFTQVFQQLFGGGRAELKLTDPKNLLDTGVDIIAQPPGKKLQHLGLLSGGERALTAISLLFAILRVRPVPFCVLDEVEAALDEANVSRFAKYIKVYSEKTQFIVITHRKGTMEEADVLYGVTMQESGVSRLVSVRLEDTKELVNS
ncbi:chromosome segregation protein SMC [Virgibacillus siamensis]|uniref:chromosome segregation protein SMC n=1 Tax=Virgibacillus siamensis TaxID=480071 RepID=UPI000984852F|nr:chromosome segregation protein SMC [Virgibacillus siamensis]